MGADCDACTESRREVRFASEIRFWQMGYYGRVFGGVSVSGKRVTQPSELCGQAWKSQPHMSEKSPI